MKTKTLIIFLSAGLILSSCTSESDVTSVSSESEVVTTVISTIEISETETITQKTDYIVNTNTGKFHYPDCPGVDQMIETNKLYYSGNKENLLEYGYTPCGRCNP